MLFYECSIPPFARLIAAGEPTAIRGIGLYDPQVGVVIHNVLVGIGRPFLVRPANPVDAQLGQDVGGVVQCLGKIFDKAPDQNMERPRVVASRAFNDPS